MGEQVTWGVRNGDGVGCGELAPHNGLTGIVVCGMGYVVVMTMVVVVSGIPETVMMMSARVLCQ